MAIGGKITSWSYSRLADYDACPLMAKYKHVMKLQEPKNAAMQRGADIHELSSGFIVGKIKTLPPELALFKDLFRDLRKRRAKDPDSVIVEDTWAFTDEWERTTWDDWDNCWLRVKLDCAEISGTMMKVTDWKTGKFRDDQVDAYGRQLELYGLAALLLFPEIEVVRPRLVYLDTSLIWDGRDPKRPIEHRRGDLDSLLKTWTKRTLPMLSDGTFRPTPGNHCRWCWFGQSGRGRGGPGLCKF